MLSDWLKRLGLAAVAVAIAAGFYLALREKPVLVDSAAVETGPMQVTIDQEGVTRVRDVYTVSSPITGNIARTTLEDGDPVKANETVIASIHPQIPSLNDPRTQAELIAAVAAARSAVSVATTERQRIETSLKLARSDLERASRLSQTQIISERTLEKAQNDVALLEAQLTAADATIRLREAELASAQARLAQPRDPDPKLQAGCCLRLTAPVDGVVLNVLAKSEQAVTPGTKIAEIGDPSNLEIVVDLLSSDAVRVKQGAEAIITDWGGDRDLSATVRRIEPSAFTKVSALGIEEQRVNAILDPDTVPEGLGHAYRVFARLVVWSSDDVLTIPIGALFRAGGDWSVFVVEDGTAHRKKITIDHMNADRAQIESGLDEGESVILYPSDLLEDGKPVATRDEG